MYHFHLLGCQHITGVHNLRFSVCVLATLKKKGSKSERERNVFTHDINIFFVFENDYISNNIRDK